MENFVLYDEIGSGNQRKVYKGRRKGTVDYVAIHCVEKGKREALQNNVRVQHNLVHPNVVEFYEWYETTNHYWLIVELCTGDSLASVIAQDQNLPEVTVKEFAKHLVCGLAYLHSLEVVYGGVCPQKVLLDTDGTLKYSNFSLAHIQGEENVPTEYKNVNYAAPEVLRGEGTSMESDLWSLGCLLYEMYTGKTPFHASSHDRIRNKVFKGSIQYPVQEVDGEMVRASENLYMLIHGLLQAEPESRIDLLELCLHPLWEGELNTVADRIETHRLRKSESYTETQRTELKSNDDSLSDIVTEMEVTEISLESQDGDDTVISQRESSVVEKEAEETVDSEDGLSEEDSLVVIPKLNVQSVDSKSLDEVKSSSKRKAPVERSLRKDVLSKVEEDNKELLKAEDNEEENELIKKGTYTISDIKRELERTPEENLSARRRSLVSKELKSSVSEPKNFSASGSTQEVSYVRQKESLQISSVTAGDANVMDYLHHHTDLHVSPIAENPKLLKQPPLKFDVSALGFTPLSAEKLHHKDTAVQHLKSTLRVQAAQQKKSDLRSKLACLAYLVQVCRGEEVANWFIEENLHKHLLKELKSAQLVEVKIRIGRLLGVLASGVTFVAPSFNMAEVFGVCTEQIKQNLRVSPVKQAYLPVIGEFMFFAATQEESEDKVFHQWEPSGAVFTIINKCLHQMDDHTSRHLAAKIIENVTTTTGRYCKKFLTNEVGLGLWNLYSHAATDGEKTTASSALCRISMHSPAVVQHVSDRAGFAAFQEGIFTGTARSQQAFVTIFIMLLTVHYKKISADETFLRRLVKCLDNNSHVLQGKICLLLAEVSRHSHKALLTCCEGKLITHVEKSFRKSTEKEHAQYANNCLNVLAANVINAIPEIFQGTIDILNAVCGRHHANPNQTKQLKSRLPLISIVLHFVTSALFRRKLLASRDFVQHLTTLLKLVGKVDSKVVNLSTTSTQQLGENFTSDTLAIVETICQHPPIVHDTPSLNTLLLPALVALRRSSNAYVRVFAVKLSVDMLVVALKKEEFATTPRAGGPQAKTSQLVQLIEKEFLEDIDSYLEDEAPLPSHCLRLLYAVVECLPHLVAKIVDEKTMSALLNALQVHVDDASVLQNIIGVLNTVLTWEQLDFLWLCKQGFSEALSNAFVEIVSVADDDVTLLFLFLDTIHRSYKIIETLMKSVLSNSGVKRSSSSKHREEKPSKYSSMEKSNKLSKDDLEDLLHLNKCLCELNGIVVNLLQFDDADICDLSSRCLYLSAELYGGQNPAWLTSDNISVFFQTIANSQGKCQKILLRTALRLASSSSQVKEKFQECCEEINKFLIGFNKEKREDEIFSIYNDLLKLIS